jgi:hypothetical protein
MQPWTGEQQVVDQRRAALDEVLAVVEYQQYVPLPQKVDQRGKCRTA